METVIPRTKYQTYEKYKDSGLEWVLNVPDHWNSRRLKLLINSHSSGVWGDDPDGSKNDVTCIRVADFDYERLSINQNEKTQRNISSWDFFKKKLHLNDLLIEKSGGGENQFVGRALLYTENTPAVCANFIEFNRLNSLVHPRFGLYLFAALYESGVSKKNVKQTTGIQNLDLTGLYNQVVFYPNLDLQKTISNFLDKKTSQIYSVIEKKKKLVELLKEKQKVLITQAVTKGLDPKARMKDSGVEWVGEIPVDWELTHLIKIAFESKNKNSVGKERNLLSLSYGTIKERDIATGFGLLPESFNTYNIIQPGMIVMRLTDLQNDKKSLRTGLVTEKGIITSAYVTLKFKSVINSEYIHYLLHSYDLNKVFYTLGGGVRQQMDFGDLKHLPITYPKKDDQDKIVKFLNKKTSIISYAIEKTGLQITKLQEYKSALIYNTVTGKIKV